jgi:hypothetical protein
VWDQSNVISGMCRRQLVKGILPYMTTIYMFWNGAQTMMSCDHETGLSHVTRVQAIL